MSRWDSLKPDSNRTRRSSNNRTTSSRNNPQHGRASTASSRPAGRHPIQPSDRRQTAGGTGNSVNDFSRDNLKQQVALYRANNKTFQPTSVVKALEDFHRCLTSRGRIEVTGDDVMLLIDLIEINDSAIHQLCVDNLELAFEKDTFISMTKTQARHCTTVLAEKCMSSSTASMLIKCLSHIILVQAKTLPAEETAQDLVGRVFVPFLQNTTTNVSTLTSICTTLAGLFQDPGHASALLAPLVNDVSADGKEQRVVNPLRRKILNALQNILYSTSSDHDSLGQVAACNSLAKAIDALRKIDGDLNTSVNSADIDWALMERFLLEAMESHSSTLFTPALILLRAMIGRYPNATTRLGSRLIMEPVSGIRSMGKGGKCSCCSKLCNEIGLLLDIAHTRIATPNTINGETKNLAVHCLADFLQSMPWKKWQNASKQDTAHQRSSGFGRKVFDSLETVIQITRCTLLRCDEISIESIARLSGTIFTEISFNENKVVDAGIELWSTLANLVIHTTTKPKIQHATTDVLVLSMGGRCTPQGDLLPMCAPGYAWLSNESSETFLCKLFDSLESNDSLSHHSFKLLSAILRTRPETAYDWWERFQGLLEKYSKNDGSGVKFVQVGLLESFMLGKRDFPTDAAHGTISVMLVELLCCVLEKARIDNHVQSRTLSFNVYAALQRSDWIVLDKEEKRLLSHFNAIISHCRESNAKVRIAACKAAGDFCTQYIATETSVDRCRFQMISHDVCETMLACLNDKNGSVRSMALFTLGNLACALREIDDSLLPKVPTRGVCIKIQENLNDSNDKVVGNAIRSIGHWIYLLAYGDSQSETIENNELYLLVLDSLSEKLSATLALVSAEKRGDLSWKQRSVAKKHGWGTCHSLAQLFQAAKVIDGRTLISSCSEVVRKLILCVEHFSSLNEKIAISAMTALLVLDPLQFAEVAGKSGLVGEALAICTIKLYETQTNPKAISSKVLKDTQLLFRHLLTCASILDACVVLKRDDFSKPTLSFLYGWMVENNVDGRAFEIFALALQRPGLMSDVSLEQSFASRSLQQYKKDQYLSLTDNSDRDDGADEL